MVTVGVLQNRPKILKVRENLKAALSLLEGHHAGLWVFPEFFATGYNFKNKKEVRQVSENVPAGITCKTLIEFSKKKKCAVVAGLVEKSGNSYYNSSVLVHEKKITIYRKTHLFGNEKKFFKPGDTGFLVKKVFGVKVGVMICFDWFFPESARTLALKGAEIILHPANLVLPWGPEGMKFRSLENRVFSVTANRIGSERGLRFIGQSQIVSPAGKILFRASANRCEIGTAQVDLRQARDKKVTDHNRVFQDRRPDLYRLK